MLEASSYGSKDSPTDKNVTVPSFKKASMHV